MPTINTKIERGDSCEVMFAKMTVRGDSKAFDKAYFYDTLTKMAEDSRGPCETPQQAFAKVITEDKTGQLLYAALKAAPGTEIKPALTTEPEKPTFIGPAHAKLHALAVDNQRAFNTTYSSAYTNVYSKPENAALRAAAKAEHLAQSMAAVGK